MTSPAMLVSSLFGFALHNLFADGLSGSGNTRILWTQVQALSPARPLGRVPAAAVSSGDRLYVFGGETDDSSGEVPNRYLNDLWEFTPSRSGGTWVELFPDGGLKGPSARVSSSMVYANGELTLFGGITRTSPLDNVVVGDVWVFDLSQRIWTTVQNGSEDHQGPGPLAAHTAILVDSRPDSMIVFGGNDANGVNSNVTWIYSLSGKTWAIQKTVGVWPTARDFHTVVAIPGRETFKMWGGVDDQRVWTYNVESGSWSDVVTGLEYLSGRGGTVVKGKVLTFGGFKVEGGGTLSYTSRVQLLHWDGTWLEAFPISTSVPDGRCYAALVSLGDYAYMFGGYHRIEGCSQQRLSDLWRLSIEDELPVEGELLNVSLHV